MIAVASFTIFSVYFLVRPCEGIDSSISNGTYFPLSDGPPTLDKPLISFNEDDDYNADMDDEDAEDSDDNNQTEATDDYDLINGKDGLNRNEGVSERPFDPQIVERYGYTLKILANSFLAGIGAYIKPGWVLSSFCLFDTAITKYHKVTVETWDAQPFSAKAGQTRSVTDIVIHPKYDEDACNYDVVLLKLANPLQLGNGISLTPLATGPKPSDNTQCVIPAPFDQNIFLTNVVISPITECKDHEEYGAAKECQDDKNLMCIHMSDRLFGAPVICEERLVGVLPSNLDTKQNLTIVQYLESFNKWVEDNTVVHFKLRSNVSLLEPFRVAYILAIIITALFIRH